ncbi:MAG: fumarylacetoacetase [Fibrobacteres bacterium]|nr:fumarylacetoacetase [Fibrobacterota bacterium]
MTLRLDDTHDAALRSWVASANAPDCDFPIQNLPFGVFKRRGAADAPRVGIAIGDRILDVYACHRAGLFAGQAADAEAAEAAAACDRPSLNDLAALGRGPRTALRRQAGALLKEGDDRIRSQADWERRLMPAMKDAEMSLPAVIGDYTDFYASVYHATNVGRLFRPDQPLLPNYKYLPIGYHGRASSIVASGTPIRRPCGQAKADDAARPSFGPSKVLDYEVEAGFLVGPGNALGEPIAIGEAEDHLFGICLVNDWSARDLQKWEYQPLGPFLAKSFATSVSPWVVTMEALEPFRVPAFPRPDGDPAPLPHLDQSGIAGRAGLNATFELHLLTPRMRESGNAPFRLSRANCRDLYWTPGQLLAHHASNGCNLRPGDLLGSGTLSGPAKENEGCLLELTLGGKEPIALPGGESRRFLGDGDEVILKAYCEAPGFARIGLGECRGTILPAHPLAGAGGIGPGNPSAGDSPREA